MPRKPKPIQTARSLRRRIVPAETILWSVLRNRALAGFKFRRQHPVGPYIVDFACLGSKVIVELDGATHLRSQRADRKRSAFLASEGWQVLRFWNTEVYDDLEPVTEVIYQACLTRDSSS